MKNIDFYIKKLSAEEISSFLKLNDNDFFEKLSDRVDIDEFSEKLHQKALHFTLYDNSRLVGFSSCYFNNMSELIGYISSLIIRSGYRHMGFGSFIVEKIKEYGKENGFKTIMVTIHINNKISSNFYKKNGFEIFKRDSKKEKMILRYSIK